MITFGSLFTGIGGIDLGLERAGMECRWQVENDPFCTRVLERHWPDVARWGDIESVDTDRFIEPVDLLAGGFPCQPVSLAGKQEGQEDRRWLWPQFARLVRHLRPRYVLVENVPGLLTAVKGGAAQEVFGDLAEYGYDAEWASIPAAAVGAPHLRYRVFIVAHARSAALRFESGRGGWTNGQGPGELRHDGAQGLVERLRAARDSDAQRKRRQVAPESYGKQEAELEAWAPRHDLDRLRNAVADPSSERRQGTEPQRSRGWSGLADRSEDVADANVEGSPEAMSSGMAREARERALERQRAEVADADGTPRYAEGRTGETVFESSPLVRPGRCGCCGGDHWATEPDVGRVANGIPHRVDRLRALGNAVVPQAAQWVGEQIVRWESGA